MDLGAAGNSYNRLVAALRWVFGPLALLFLVIAAWRAHDLLSAVLAQVQPAVLVLTVLLWALLHLLTPFFASMVLREMDAGIGYRTMLAIHVGRLPTRYLPGGVWHTVTRVMDLHRLGVGRSQLSVMVALENLVPLATALCIGGSFLYVAGGTAFPALGAAAAGLVLLACTPVGLRHRALLAKRRLSQVAYVKLLGISTVFWLIAATSFACYWTAFPAIGEAVPTLRVYGVYLVAWAAGFVSIFAPQGIGVFEAVAGAFLGGALSFAGVAVLAAGFRVVILAADVLAYLALQAFRYTRHASGVRH